MKQNDNYIPANIYSLETKYIEIGTTARETLNKISLRRIALVDVRSASYHEAMGVTYPLAAWSTAFGMADFSDIVRHGLNVRAVDIASCFETLRDRRGRAE
jgi:hypothetical protein